MKKVIISIIVIVISFAVGRYSIQKSVVSTENIVDSKKKNEVKDTHTVKTITKIKDKNGQEKTITVIDTKVTDKVTEKNKVTDDKKQISTPMKGSNLNVSGLAAYDFDRKALVYGVHVSRSLIGPITMGLWGLTNGSIGLSVGINF